MKLLVMQFSPPSHHSISLWSKYSPQHPVLFVIDDVSLFTLNSDLHNFNTRGKNDHLLQPRLSNYSDGIYYMGIKTFNHLPSCIKFI
jgi:hypothetical protein